MDSNSTIPLISTNGNHQLVEHVTVNGKYRIVFEKAASANKIDGFKIEVNGDDRELAMMEARALYTEAINVVEANKPIPTPAPAGK